MAPAARRLSPWLEMRSGFFCFVTDLGHREKKSWGFVLTVTSADANADGAVYSEGVESQTVQGLS